MDTLLVSSIPAFESGNETEICNKLQEFTKENADTFSFADVGLETKKKFIGDVLHTLEVVANPECQLLCLEALKIFSRDKYNMLQLEQKECIFLLLKRAGLSDDTYEFNVQVITEAQKCLCNLVFNNLNVQVICSDSPCVTQIMTRIRSYSEESMHWDVIFYDMRLLFLLTALVRDLRSIVRNRMCGIPVLTEVLETQVLCNITNKTSTGAGDDSDAKEILTNQQATLAGEILKVMFNVVVHVSLEDLQTEDEEVWKRLGSALRALLMSETDDVAKTEDYHSHTINLLTCCIPQVCILQLIPEPQGATGGSTMYQGYNMDCIAAMLKFLEMRIDRSSSAKEKRLVEQLNPCIGTLCMLARGNRYIRKYLRSEVLPPLRDATKLPEEGDYLRNKLVRLMTNPSTEVKESVADFIFILCKESVNRMVKYTGYGNAAGMLARRGLLAGGRGNTDYSSDDDNSDTEEYREIRDRVNPVTGRVEDDKPDPLEGMSDEQKEFHANELAAMITKMSGGGVITPMTVGADGRLVSMEEAFHRTTLRENPSDSDNDDD